MVQKSKPKLDPLQHVQSQIDATQRKLAEAWSQLLATEDIKEEDKIRNKIVAPLDRLQEMLFQRLWILYNEDKYYDELEELETVTNRLGQRWIYCDGDFHFSSDESGNLISWYECIC